VEGEAGVAGIAAGGKGEELGEAGFCRVEPEQAGALRGLVEAAGADDAAVGEAE
jgi:hypothetical protein